MNSTKPSEPREMWFLGQEDHVALRPGNPFPAGRVFVTRWDESVLGDSLGQFRYVQIKDRSV